MLMLCTTFSWCLAKVSGETRVYHVAHARLTRSIRG